MALVDIGALVALPATFPGSAAAGYTIDATGEIAALVFQAREAGDVTGVCFRLGAVTTPKTLRIGLQAVSATGVPDGTWLGAGAAGYYDQTSPAAYTYYNVTLGAAVPLTVGAWYAVVFRWADDGDPGNLVVNVNTQRSLFPSGIGASSFPFSVYGVNPTTQKLGGTSGLPGVCLLFSGVARHQVFKSPVLDPNVLVALDSDGARQAAGNRFQVPFSARAAGVAWYGDMDFDTVAMLYSDAGATLASSSHDSDYRVGTIAGMQYRLFATPYTLAANTWYRAGVAAGTTTAGYILQKVQFDAAALLGQEDLGENCYYTSFNGVAWFDVTTERAYTAILIDQVDAGGASSGGGCSIIGGSIVRRA